MTRMKLTLMTAITAAALGASPLVVANPAVPMTDKQAAKAIQRADISLHQAIMNAEQWVAGQAIAARFAENADELVYMVEVIDKKGRVQMVRVTADEGRVTGSWPKATYQGDSMSYQEP